MLKDEFEKLQELFRQATEGKASDVGLVYKEALKFFERLKEQVVQGSPEDKLVALEMMMRLYQEMLRDTKKISERVGMSPEQLMNFAENPANFTKEQWEALQASKKHVSGMGHSMSQAIGLEDEKIAPTPENAKPKDVKGKRSKWMRS